LRLDRFPRGVDNLHIDVALGPVLGRAVGNYISALVRENAQRLWQQPVSAFSDAVVESFGGLLQEHHLTVVKGARASNRLERVQLFQLAVLKLFLNLIDAELSALRLGLNDARGRPASQLSGQSLELHRHAVILGRHAEHVRYRIANQLMREYMRLERGGMRNLRKAVLGLSWPVPESMLNNPVLQLDGVGAARDFYRIYPLLLQDPATSRTVSRCVMDAFSEWLPENMQPSVQQNPTMASPFPADRLDQGNARGFLETERRVRGLIGQLELNEGPGTWLDCPDNAIALLGGAAAHWPQPGPWRQRGIDRLQRDLSKRLASSLAGAGLMRAVTASYELAAIYPLSGLVDAESLVFDFLKGVVKRRDMMRRLGGMEGVSDARVPMRRIEGLCKDYRGGVEARKQQLLARFAGDFLRLRRDLKLGWRTFVAMDSLRLVTEEGELGRFQDNPALQVFCRAPVPEDTRSSVNGHVIVKADIRGFAEVTVQMRRRNLDPAAHFSRFFYDPVNRLLDQFGAQKVVVEGDALILSLLERGAEEVDCLAVARGCCLAARIILVMDAMNAENDRIGLPRVELGLGVAYADEAPTYLYDHARKVIISPAIQRARLLSSCHVPLRETCSLPGGRGVCVASAVPGEPVDGRGGETLFRYNVNGIELDATAFAQLNVEISLRRLRRNGKRPATFYAGRCPDVNGESHWLVVRERVVKMWIGRQLLKAGDEGRRYYEVVSDPRLIERIDAKLSRDDPEEAGQLSRVRH
jgi:hypothetical protein